MLDFANDTEQIQDAFAPFFETTIAEPTDPNLLYNAAARLDEFAVVDRDEAAGFTASSFLALRLPREQEAVLTDDPPEPAALTADPDDDYLIARAGGADYLVSGDRHLTELIDLDPPVLTLRRFLMLLGEG